MTLFKNRNIIYELTRKQVKTQYRDSALGFLWTILNPLLNMLVMWLVFKSVLGITDPYYPIYLLTGNILFAALRSSTNQALQSMVNNRGLLLRTKVDLYIFPLSNVLTSIVNFAFSLIACGDPNSGVDTTPPAEVTGVSTTPGKTELYSHLLNQQMQIIPTQKFLIK